MKFLNKETKTILEVNAKNKSRIAKLKGYPDKFEIINEPQNTAKDKTDNKTKNQNTAKDKTE